MDGSAHRERRHLLLIGGGHSHLHVLRMAAMEPIAAGRITLVAPEPYAMYSGMIPGAIAGLYRIDEARIDLRALAARAGIRFLRDRAVEIDAAAHRVHCAELPPLHYDVLSVDIGSRPRAAPAAPALLPIRPIEGAVQRLLEFAEAARAGRIAGRIAVVGAGAGGVEVAFAVRARLGDLEGAAITLIDRAAVPLPGYGRRMSARVARLLPQYGIDFIGNAEVAAIDAGALLSDGRRIDAELIVWASGAEGLPLLGELRLPVDDRGFLLVDQTLRCIADPSIFAAGDCATLAKYPQTPKAGVYAVRQGPVLWRNLRAVLTDSGSLKRYRPQSGFLSLLSTGDGAALLSYHGLTAHGAWVWRLKDRIDRRFIEQHSPPRAEQFATADRGRAALSTVPMGAGEMAPCGGCAAKVSGDVLARVLRRLPREADESVVVGLEEPDDAAVVRHRDGHDVVSTVDFFPPFLDDPYVVGGVAAVNAASDLYAMGAEPTAAIALVALPASGEEETEETLELLLQGAVKKLGEMGVPLVGGHTIEGEQLLVGFAVLGSAAPGGLLRKSGARAGDRLVLTKPLGTGVILAAARAGLAPATWVESAIVSMLRSNRVASIELSRLGVCACTDVTGFGLAGHLAEMLRASGVAARLELEHLPALPGAIELLGAGVRSSFHERNRAYRRLISGPTAAVADLRCELLADPQTSGGLLASVPVEGLAELRAALHCEGESCHEIGSIVAGDGIIELVADASSAP